MTLIIPGGYANVQFLWSSDTFFKGRAITQIGYTFGETTLNELATLVAEVWNDTLRPLTSALVTLDAVVAQSAAVQAFQGVGEQGTGSSSNAEPSVALLTKKETSIRGPRAKGRSYWPGLAFEATFNASGLMSVSDQGDYQAAFDEFYNGVEAGGETPVILQNTEGISPPLAAPPPVSRFAVDRRAATQRRRLRS